MQARAVYTAFNLGRKLGYDEQVNRWEAVAASILCFMQVRSLDNNLHFGVYSGCAASPSGKAKTALWLALQFGTALVSTLPQFSPLSTTGTLQLDAILSRSSLAQTGPWQISKLL